MAFRNPVHTIPANRITGQLTGAQIVNGAIAYPHLTGPLSSAASVRYLDMMDDASLWENVSGAGTWGMVPEPGSTTTGSVLQSVGLVSMRGRVRIPYDPDVLYRVSVRLRCTNQPGAAPNLFLGLHGFAADGVTPVNRNGANSVLTQHYAAANSTTITPAAGWVVYTGYVKGRANPGLTGPCPSMTAPGAVHTNVRYVAPMVRVDTNSTGATIQVDRVSVDVVYTGVLTAEAVSAGAIDGQVITGATVRTSAGYPRIELSPDGSQYFYTAAGQDPGLFRVDGDAGVLQLVGPNGGGVEYGVTFQKAFGSSSTTIDTDETIVSGLLRAGNLAIGRVSITPSAANTPTSVTVSGLGLVGSFARAVATAQSQFVGTSVTGVGCTGAGPSAVAVWLTRSNTTAVLVDYIVISDQ